MRIGGLEAGGTKMVCAVGNEKGEVLERISIPTLTPDETFPEMIAYYKEKKIDALGIGSFGPVDLWKYHQNTKARMVRYKFCKKDAGCAGGTCRL